jgi:hypothetical protein
MLTGNVAVNMHPQQWERLVSLNISWDFDVLGKVSRKRGRSLVDDPS